MNYLAHIFLSGDDRRVQIGNFIGDAVKGDAYKQYAPGFREGILLHRKIDDFADHHPLVKEAVDWGRPHFGRYSAVVTDIFFDYFLATDFPEYSGKSLQSFAWGFYGAMVRNYFRLPDRIRGFLWHFILTNRLKRYASPEGIRQSLEIMATYRNLQVSPEEAVVYLEQHREEWHALFREFFPEVQEMCRNELSVLALSKVSR